MLQSIGTAKPGFDQSHFSASYKMRYGVTPTQSAAQNEI
jgi:AraC-like DNA-binding protein